jgi:succinoglycan biosynthesis transport protein ExoP
VINALAALYDVVLIDCPPALPVTDAAVIVGVVDATLLAVTAGVTARREIIRTIQVLAQVHAPLIGTVLNGVTADTGGEYYRYSQYKQYASSDGKAKAPVPEMFEPVTTSK